MSSARSSSQKQSKSHQSGGNGVNDKTKHNASANSSSKSTNSPSEELDETLKKHLDESMASAKAQLKELKQKEQELSILMTHVGLAIMEMERAADNMNYNNMPANKNSRWIMCARTFDEQAGR